MGCQRYLTSSVTCEEEDARRTSKKSTVINCEDLDSDASPSTKTFTNTGVGTFPLIFPGLFAIHILLTAIYVSSTLPDKQHEEREIVKSTALDTESTPILKHITLGSCFID